MKCKLCGTKTGKFLRSYHMECVSCFKDQWYLMGKAIDEYHLGITSKSVAMGNFMRATEDVFIQNYFWENIYSHSELRTYDKLIFSQGQIQAREEKKQSKNICPNGTIALTDSGIYILGGNTFYIPYRKVIDVGTEKMIWFGTEVYIDVRTSSPLRHRYGIKAVDKKDENFAYTVCDIVRFMAGIESKEKKNHLIRTNPKPIDLLFRAYPVEATVLPVDMTQTKIAETKEKVPVVENIPYQTSFKKHIWTMEEDELCCRKYLELYVIAHSNKGLYQFVEELSAIMPEISKGSLRMKTQNIKQLCIEHCIPDSLTVKPLSQYSKQNATAFNKVLTDLRLSKTTSWNE